MVRWDTAGQDPLLKVCGSSVMVEFATGINLKTRPVERVRDTSDGKNQSRADE